MIYLKVHGGLGNQMFQYATGRALADRAGVQLVLDLNWYVNTPRGDTRREFGLVEYGLRFRHTSGAERLGCRFHTNRWLRRLPQLFRPWKHVREAGLATSLLELEQLARAGDCYLDGYWQDCRNFAGIRPQLLSELVPLAPLSASQRMLADYIGASNSLALHVRRGDYLSNPAAAAAHGVCGVDYYRRALNHMAGQLNELQVFVFSDDLNWARERFGALPRTVCVDDAGTPATSLHLMALCRHQIIANSSFSWWAAWLGSNQDKCVVAPAQWYSNPQQSGPELPPNWVRM